MVGFLDGSGGIGCRGGGGSGEGWLVGWLNWIGLDGCGLEGGGGEGRKRRSHSLHGVFFFSFSCFADETTPFLLPWA